MKPLWHRGIPDCRASANPTYRLKAQFPNTMSMCFCRWNFQPTDCLSREPFKEKDNWWEARQSSVVRGTSAASLLSELRPIFLTSWLPCIAQGVHQCNSQLMFCSGTAGTPRLGVGKAPESMHKLPLPHRASAGQSPDSPVATASGCEWKWHTFRSASNRGSIDVESAAVVNPKCQAAFHKVLSSRTT